MAASALATLGLDSSEFETGLKSAEAAVKRLDPLVKASTAQLALMELSFRRLGAASGVSAAQIAAQRRVVTAQTADLRAEKLAADQLKSALVPPKNTLFSAIAKAIAGGAVLSFLHTLTTAGREASALTRELDKLDLSTYSDKFTEADASAKGFRNSLLDLTAAASNIPVIGSIIDIALSPLKKAADNLKLIRATNAALNRETGDSAGVLAKIAELQQRRSELRDAQADAQSPVSKKAVQVSGTEKAAALQELARQGELEMIENRLTELRAEVPGQMEKESSARNAILAGSKKQAALDAIEIQKSKEIAALRNSQMIPNSGGAFTPAGAGTVAEGTANIEREAGAKRQAVNRAYSDDLRLLRLQTVETEARLKGYTAIANRAAIMAKYDQQIVNALRDGNTEAAELLTTQKNLAMIQEKAREHDQLPGQGVADRKAARDLQTKAKQQDAREAELERRSNAGIQSRAIKEFNARKPVQGPVFDRDAQNRQKAFDDLSGIFTLMKGGN